MKRLALTIRHRLEYAAFRAVAAALGALPLETASRLSGKCWRLVAPRLSRHRRALDAIALAMPDLPAARREELIRDMWENLGRVFAESFHLHDIRHGEHVVIENEEALVRAHADDPRFVVAGVHLGNWEAGAIAARVLNPQICGIYQRVSNPLVDAYVRALREPAYGGGLFPKQDRAARKVMAQMRRGASLVTMGDLRDWRGPSVTFFGHPAPTNIYPALLARTLGAPFYAGMVARTPRDGRHVRFTAQLVRIDMPMTDDREADALAATERAQAAFESFIRAYPGQWMWAHRRWG